MSEMRLQRMVRAMKCGGAPTQPTYNHHPTLIAVLHFFVHRQTECIPACDLTCYFSRFTYCCSQCNFFYMSVSFENREFRFCVTVDIH